MKTLTGFQLKYPVTVPDDRLPVFGQALIPVKSATDYSTVPVRSANNMTVKASDGTVIISSKSSNAIFSTSSSFTSVVSSLTVDSGNTISLYFSISQDEEIVITGYNYVEKFEGQNLSSIHMGEVSWDSVSEAVRIGLAYPVLTDDASALEWNAGNITMLACIYPSSDNVLDYSGFLKKASSLTGLILYGTTDRHQTFDCRMLNNCPVLTTVQCHISNYATYSGEETDEFVMGSGLNSVSYLYLHFADAESAGKFIKSLSISETFMNKVVNIRILCAEKVTLDSGLTAAIATITGYKTSANLTSLTIFGIDY